MAPVFIIVIALIQAILAYAHFLVYRTLVSVFALSGGPWLTVLRIVFVVLAVSFVAASILTFSYYNPAVRWFYIVAATWLVLLLYLFLAACLYLLGSTALEMVAPLASTAWLGKVLLVLAVLAGVYGLVNDRQLMVTKLDIKLPNLPAEWQGKKMVWVSDMHLGSVYGTAFMDKIADEVAGLNPDIILVGGDVYDGTTFPIETSIAPLSRLRAPLGTYFITGNHEEFGDDTKYLAAIRQAGITILNNEITNIKGLQLIGVDYNDTVNRDRFAEILNSLSIDKDKPSILLKHAPLALDVAAKAGISFQISGHTHRAQLWPLSYITQLVYHGFDYGLHYYGSMPVYTSSGAGTWGPPGRVGNPSEIVLIELK